uniref:Uncharacterized protein n=1 Tax=Arundo donax TaxID=35708 RepID=A0A0A9H4W4_ARUDO
MHADTMKARLGRRWHPVVCAPPFFSTSLGTAQQGHAVNIQRSWNSRRQDLCGPCSQIWLALHQYSRTSHTSISMHWRHAHRN